MRSLIAAVLLVFISFNASAQERWPKYVVDPKVVSELNDRFEGTSGRFHDTSYVSYLQEYKPFGDYLNWGKWRAFADDGEVVIHSKGMPQVRDGDIVYWNTVTLCHYALTIYGRFIRGDQASRDLFLAAVDKLIELQSPNGGFPYPTRQHRHTTLPDDWISAMAQGNALSVFARALQIKRDPRYIRAGELAFATFMTPVDKGGARTSMADLDPSLSGYVFFPEYPNKPIDYTLNGYMFALLGVYDWSHINSTYRNQAKVLFRAGMKTLKHILYYHDVAGFSTYDLAHLVLNLPPYVTPDYLGIHVYLLHALNSIAPNNILAMYKQKWAAKIDAMNKLLKFTIIKTDFQSPQPVGKVITIKLDSEGGDGTPKLYKYDVKNKGEWATLATYSEANSFIWTPREPGEYIFGFFVKNKGSKKEWDNFRHQTFVVQ